MSNAKPTRVASHTPTPWIYIGQTNVGHHTYAIRVGASTVYFQKEADAVFTHRAVNAHEELVTIAKKYHGYDDPLHLRAMPVCAECKTIAKAEDSQTHGGK